MHAATDSAQISHLIHTHVKCKGDVKFKKKEKRIESCGCIATSSRSSSSSSTYNCKR